MGVGLAVQGEGYSPLPENRRYLLAGTRASAGLRRSLHCGFILVLLGRVFGHSLSKRFLSIYYEPGGSRPRGTAVDKTKSPALEDLAFFAFLWGIAPMFSKGLGSQTGEQLALTLPALRMGPLSHQQSPGSSVCTVARQL